MASLGKLGGTSRVAMTAHYVIVEAATFGSLQDARCSFSAFVLYIILPRPLKSARIQCHHHSLSHRYFVCSDSHSWWWTAQVAACTWGCFLPGAVIYSFIARFFILVLTPTLNVYREAIWCGSRFWWDPNVHQTWRIWICISQWHDSVTMKWISCIVKSKGILSSSLEFIFLANVPRGNVVHSH